MFLEDNNKLERLLDPNLEVYFHWLEEIVMETLKTPQKRRSQNKEIYR